MRQVVGLCKYSHIYLLQPCNVHMACAGTLVHYIYRQRWNPGPLISTSSTGTLVHYICWQRWNPGPLYLLHGCAGTLIHYICWQHWNPGPLHLLTALEPLSITSTGNIETLVNYIFSYQTLKIVFPSRITSLTPITSSLDDKGPEAAALRRPLPSVPSRFVLNSCNSHWQPY